MPDGERSAKKRCYSKALLMKPHSYIASFEMALLHARSGQIATAVRCLTRSMKINPDYACSHRNGDIIFETGKLHIVL